MTQMHKLICGGLLLFVGISAQEAQANFEAQASISPIFDWFDDDECWCLHPPARMAPPCHGQPPPGGFHGYPPPPQPAYSPVGNYGGGSFEGASSTRPVTNINVYMLPDPHMLRQAMNSAGEHHVNMSSPSTVRGLW